MLLRSFLFGFCFSVIICGFIFAGSLTPDSPPTPTMHSFNDIYALIDGAATSTPSLSPTEPVESTMHSISELYVDLANLINPASTTVTYLGISPISTPTEVSAITKEFNSTSNSGTVTGFTLDDIYNLITENIRPLDPNHTFAPSLEPTTGTMHTLTEIYNKLAGIPDPFILPETIATGTVYLGVTGTYVPEPVSPCDAVCQVLRVGLTAYWPFDNDLVDYSENTNDATNNGGVFISGKNGQGLDFDGSLNKYAQVPDDQTLRISPDITISAWVYYKVPLYTWGGSTVGYIIEKGEYEEDNYSFYVLNDGLSFEFRPPGEGIKYIRSSLAVLTENRWSHVAVIFNDSTNKIDFYVDGNLADSKNNTFSLDSTISHDLLIGRQNAVGYYLPFNGTIDELAVWNRALSDNEIQQIYNNGSGRSLTE